MVTIQRAIREGGIIYRAKGNQYVRCREDEWNEPYMKDTADLEASMCRLEATEVSIAVREDGSMRVVVTEDEPLKAIDAGGTTYSPQDMYHYVTLSPSERLMLHSFKKRFGGTTEWRKS